MIAGLEGYIEEIADSAAVINVNGVFFEVLISLSTAQELSGKGKGESVRLFTYMYVREDAMMLYGFMSKDELELFKKLITVSGIGPKGALSLLSTLSADGLRFAIISGDSKAIAKAPGIGKRTAERLVIDLRDKLEIKTAEDLSDTGFLSGDDPNQQSGSSEADDAVMALAALGYSRSEAAAVVNKALKDGRTDTESILKAALTYL